MEEPSGLNSQAKLLEDTNHKLLEVVLLEKSTLFSLEISVGTPNNGPLKNSSRDVEPLPELELLWTQKLEDQEDSHMLNSLIQHLLLKP
jgi:hypothetical protein